MQIATVAETVTVTGESPVVDVKSTGVAATFDKTQLDEVPTATDMWAVLHQSPASGCRGTTWAVPTRASSPCTRPSACAARTGSSTRA